MSDDRRHYSRISFTTQARLYYPQGECSVDVHDLSLKGALIGTNPVLMLPHGTAVSLRIPLDETSIGIRMDGQVTHCQAGQLGIVCQEIDLDSITHLRRLVELNLGDEALLQREWHHLIAE